MQSNEREALLERLATEVGDEEVLSEVRDVLIGADTIPLPIEALEDSQTNAETVEKSKSVQAQIAECSIPQKIKLALFGNQLTRAILIRDSNKIIPFFVLQNPRLTSGEIQEIARSANSDSNVLRAIASNPAWLKDYQVKLALVCNPKVPINVSLPLVKYLKERELKQLARSKSIPQVLANGCAKLLGSRQPK